MRRRRHPNTAPRPTGPRINERVRAERVLLIDEDGSKLGVFLPADALHFARSKGLDLVEVVPNAHPPVCRVGDWGKMKYERKKKAAESRRRQHTTVIKELKVRPKTDDHDLEVKGRRARSFLAGGDKVRIVVWFRGREHAHHDIGAQQCMRLADSVSDLCRIEQSPRMDGRRMVMLLAPQPGVQSQGQEAA